MKNNSQITNAANNSQMSSSTPKLQGFTGNQLKLIAIIAMTIDHLTWTLWPGNQHHWWIICLHLIGRITAPIMWFMIVEGFHHTKNLKNYILRLFIFSIVSHFAYNFCFGFNYIPLKTNLLNQTSIMWSLTWAVIALTVFSTKYYQWPDTIKFLVIIPILLITFPADWSYITVLAVILINDNYGNLKKQTLSILLCILPFVIYYFLYIDKIYAFIPFGIILVYPFIKNYNGQRGTCKSIKWFFYIYYPLHLFLLGLLRLYLSK